jgi:hypothetical protein
MTTCDYCGKKIGFFALSTTCTEGACEKQFHNECENKVTCSKCNYAYCKEHILKHDCNPDDDEEKDEEDDDEPQDRDEFVDISKNETWALIEYDNASTNTDFINVIEELETKGYEFVAEVNDKILMRKKNG